MAKKGHCQKNAPDVDANTGMVIKVGVKEMSLLNQICNNNLLYKELFFGVVIVLLADTLVLIYCCQIVAPSYAHIPDGIIQTWTNPKDNVKIQFSYFPEMPIIDTFTALNFSVQDLQTGDHVRDFTARIVVTNGQRLFKFENISVPNGDFGVKYIFPDDGTHQVILRIGSESLLELASFDVFVPHQSPPSILDPFPSSPGTSGDTLGILVSKILAILLPAAAVTALIIMLKKKPKRQ
jgi:hypothetical protein